jgi:hypothetical protein
MSFCSYFKKGKPDCFFFFTFLYSAIIPSLGKIINFENFIKMQTDVHIHPPAHPLVTHTPSLPALRTLKMHPFPPLLLRSASARMPLLSVLNTKWLIYNR